MKVYTGSSRTIVMRSANSSRNAAWLLGRALRALRPSEYQLSSNQACSLYTHALTP